MNLALWIIAVLLAVVFLASGAAKLALPKEKLVAYGMKVLADFSAGTIKAIGFLELLAAVGLILPAALGILPVLVPLAAVGLVLLMVSAATTHRRRHEIPAVVVCLGLAALAGIVAWGRFGPQPFVG